MSGPLVEIRNVSHAFGAAKVLDSVSLNVGPGSYTVLLGPSGSGKTTLLSILGGFLAPSAGKVLIRGVDFTRIPPANRPTTTVFQDYALFPHLNAGANVGFGLRMRGVPRAQRDARAAEALALVGLKDSFCKKPHELSGGQRQRVALARALVVEPAVLLLDEPLGALDLKLRRQMQDELKALQQRVDTAFIHVTHDQEEAMALADHCVVMNQGRIEDEGPAERVYSKPATRFAATFMGESTLLAGTLRNLATGAFVETAIGRLTVADQGTDGASVSIAIRHEFPDRCVHAAEAAILADPRNEWTLADRYATDDMFIALPEGWDQKRYRVPAAPAGRILGHADIVDLGDRAFEVIHTPGHSPGGIALLERGTGILLSGDIVYDGPLIDDAYHSEAGDYLATLERMRGLAVSVAHGGHFPSFGPVRYRQIIDEYLASKRRAGCHLQV